MFDEHGTFRNREEAGRRLAARLGSYRDSDPIILALSAGGVVVAEQVARSLEAQLEVFPVQELGAPGYPELSVGALAPGGVLVADEIAASILGVSRAELQEIAREAIPALYRRRHGYCQGHLLPSFRSRTVILVDDGPGSGMPARAAIQAIRREQPLRLVLAIPVCAPRAAAALRWEVDALVSLAAPQDFRAVGCWYADFHPVSD